MDLWHNSSSGQLWHQLVLGRQMTLFSIPAPPIIFHSKAFFHNYRLVQHEDVQPASGTSLIVGIRDVYIPIAGGMYVEAFHIPQFAENIISVGLLSKSFDVLFSSDNHDEFMLLHRKGNSEVSLHNCRNGRSLPYSCSKTRRESVSHSHGLNI